MSIRPVRAYVYTDEKGRPKLRKLRRDKPLADGRKFVTESWSDRGACWVGVTDRQEDFKRKALYRLPEVLWALRDCEDIYWDEGEKCADAMRSRYGVVATSHWQGAMAATREQAAWFRRAKKADRDKPEEWQRVFIVADVDGAGAACALRRKHLLNKVMDAAYFSKKPIPCMNVTILAPPHPHKDAAEAVMAGAELADFREPDIFKLDRAAKRYLDERAATGHRESSDWVGFTKDWKPEQIGSKAKRKTKRKAA